MRIFNIAPPVILILSIACLARAEKKIELQDIEDDNIKSEKQKDDDTPESKNVIASERDLLPLEFLKNGLLRYFENPQSSQQSRYVHQYAVSEPPEKQNVKSKPKYGPPPVQPQQAMVGYLSSVPMQIYLVPQYYGEPSEQASNGHIGVQYAPQTGPRVTAYPSGADVGQQNYVEVPAYVTSSGKGYVHPQYTPQITYVTYAPQPTPAPNGHVTVLSGPAVTAPQATPVPIMTYPVPLIQYPTQMMAPTIYTKNFHLGYNKHAETSGIEDVPENEIENPKHYPTQAEIPYSTATNPEFPRYYSSRAPIRDEHRHPPVPDLPHPPPILLRSQPPHLSGLPKALPMFRPIAKPVYSAPGNLIPRPADGYGYPKKRPSSLLDSYIPSSVQLEYLKRGFSKDPLSVYDALSSGRSGFSHQPVSPRYYERGFLPNQMYQTAAGGVTFGHYKRTPKLENKSNKK